MADYESRTDREIEDWLTAELGLWNHRFGTCGAGAEAEDNTQPPIARPPDIDLDDITQKIMGGLERPIVVRGPLKLRAGPLVAPPS